MEEKKKYNIGLDIGTSSVGWAVVESGTQKIIKKGTKKSRKSLWGVRMFEEASTAAERRLYRSSRRRYDRRRNRIKRLQNEFASEISKVDKDFFQKLRESKYHKNDEQNKKIVLSDYEKNKIKEYNENYKTIYHLRSRLIHDSSQEDIRLVYLAIHHIIKYRGNFLYDTKEFNVNHLNLVNSLKTCFASLSDFFSNLNFSENYEEVIDFEKIANILMKSTKNDIRISIKQLLEGICENKKFSTEFGKLIVGNKFSLKNLFLLEELETDMTISFNGTDYEDKYNELEELLGDKIEVLNALKELYDIIFLKSLFKDSDTLLLSDLMVKRYNLHKEDLRFLKQMLRNTRDLYNQVFRTSKETCLYELYIHNQMTYEEFVNKLQKIMSKVLILNIDEQMEQKYKKEVQPRIENGGFLPKITDCDNGKYPYQLHKEELIKIIENQGKYYPFLLDKVNGEYKLLKLLEFNIPYYVGPLVTEDKSPFAWMERKKDGVKITPYNFDEVVDKEATAEKFIKRMISHCTYLLNEYALPNHSILYSKFKVMNELKQIKINNQKLDNHLTQKIITELFMKTNGSITDKRFKEYLYTLNEFDMFMGDIEIKGYSADHKFANNMQSYVDFFGENGIFNSTSYTVEDAEKMIEWITIFKEKDILEKKIRDAYPDLLDNQVKMALSRKYSGWGRLSRKLLTGLFIKDKKSGVPKNIMDFMQETNENFMQIINNEHYKFQKLIDENNLIKETKKINYDLVKDLVTSPSTKKAIYQSLKIIEELVNYMGYEPENIMIEMARGGGKKERTIDRKKYIETLYKNLESNKAITYFTNFEVTKEELKKIEKIDSQKLFLYFIQEGKCLYSGEPINIEDLSNCEIDHILPRTLIKDDSIDNKALVYRNCNQKKAASFVLPPEYRNNYRKKWWTHLKENGLMTEKKFYRLTREFYTDEDIQNFINRQLVETRQIMKHVANIIKSLYKKTKVIYLKAELSHHYREKFALFKFREINDYHHAHDAYLAAVLGEYKEKYLKRNVNFEMIKEMNYQLRMSGDRNQLKYGYFINCLDKNVNDIVIEMCKSMIDDSTGELLFDVVEFNKRIEDALYRNDILVTRKTEIRNGKFFKETIYPKKVGRIKIKENMPTHLYGGYSNMQTAYLVLVKYGKKVKLIGIPVDIRLKSRKDSTVKSNFIKEHLGVDTFQILKDHIPYEAFIDYKGQKVYIKGYTVANKNCELCNARQLKIPREKMKKWRYVLNKVLNKVDIPWENDNPILSDDEIIKVMLEIITYLYQQKENYPLFINEINKIEEKIGLGNLDYEALAKIISQLFTIYHCDSIHGNLKEFGLKDRIGRLCGKNIESGVIISRSITGIREDQYEF